MKKAFSLSELLIALTVVGVIVGILSPIARRLLPNETILRTKKAYHVASVILNDMLHDDNCYPDLIERKSSNGGASKTGEVFNFTALYNPYRYPNCQEWSGVGDEYDEDGKLKLYATKEGDTSAHCIAGEKFIHIFMERLGCTEDNIATIDDSGECGGKIYVCQTPDKMTWSFRNPKTIAENSFIYSYVDVNGPDSPNRREKCSRPKLPLWDFKLNGQYNVVCEANNKREDGTYPHELEFYDTFRFNYSKNGAITINDPTSERAIYEGSDVR